MSPGGTLLQLTWNVLTALLYIHVARTIWRRATSPTTRVANDLFALFWAGLAALSVISALFYVPEAIGVTSPALLMLGVDAALLALCVACWGLLYYLVFLYTGQRKWLAPLTVGYALLLTFFIGLIAWMQPVGLESTSWGLTVAYARQPPLWVSIASGLLLSGPIVGGAIAYGSLYWRVDDRAARARIAIISLSFLAWFGWGVLQNITGLSRVHADDLGLMLVNRAFALLVPLIVYATYHPPAWLRARTGLTPIEVRS